MRRRLLLVLGAVMSSGCVYYNGVYNANAAAKTADARLVAGGESDASSYYQQSAEKAESVLVRFPTSSWRTRALYLSGRGNALGAQCDKALPRLSEFLAARGSTRGDRDRARVALASCELRTGHVADARARLDSLVDAGDAVTARQARLWAARAALSVGDRDAVARYLGDANENTLPWELMQASLSAQEFARVESLLVQRAARNDYRDDVTRAMRELWAAGRFDGVEMVARSYDAARVRTANLAAMHFTLGDLNLRSANDSVARRHLTVVRTLAGRDTVLDREAAARLTYLAMLRASSLREIDSVLARQDSAVWRTPYAKRVTEQLLLVRLLAQQNDPTAASQYLAAEVARDSLNAIVLARTLFLQVARAKTGTPLAPQAWYAAGLLEPDSAATWRDRIRQEHGASAVAAWLAGEDPSTRPDYAATPPLLTARWSETIRTWSDSVRKLRNPVKPTTLGPGRPR